MIKKVIVTGCNGQLGRAVQLQFSGNTEYELWNTSAKELDITDIDKCLTIAREIKPYAIINCAAFTNVNQCETAGDIVWKVNALGPRNLSIAATEVGAKLVHISTDYVFDGCGTRPYTEFDTPAPKSAYGTTKLAGEKFVQQFAKDYFIIRTAWLYGDGNNFVKTMLKLSDTHDIVRVVMDQLGTPTSAKELARAVAFLLPTENYGIFHGTCEGSTNWADFAKEIFRLAGKTTRVEPITTEEYVRDNPASANRPAYSILDNFMFRLTGDFQFAQWEDAFKVYLKELLG